MECAFHSLPLPTQSSTMHARMLRKLSSCVCLCLHCYTEEATATCSRHRQLEGSQKHNTVKPTKKQSTNTTNESQPHRGFRTDVKYFVYAYDCRVCSLERWMVAQEHWFCSADWACCFLNQARSSSSHCQAETLTVLSTAAHTHVYIAMDAFSGGQS